MMWKVPKITIGLGVVILILIFALGQESLWSGVSSSVSNVRPEQSLGEWLNLSKDSGNTRLRNCCCSSGPVEDKNVVIKSDSVKQLVYEEYAKKLNDNAITVEVNDLGCHFEARVLQDGKTIKHLSVSEGSIQEVE